MAISLLRKGAKALGAMPKLPHEGGKVARGATAKAAQRELGIARRSYSGRSASMPLLPHQGGRVGPSSRIPIHTDPPVRGYSSAQKVSLDRNTPKRPRPARTAAPPVSPKGGRMKGRTKAMIAAGGVAGLGVIASQNRSGSPTDPGHQSMYSYRPPIQQSF